MTTQSIGFGDEEPLAVSPRRTAFLLSCGVTRVYELINSGELESYKEGTSRKITMRSIRARIEHLLWAARAACAESGVSISSPVRAR